MQRVAMSLAGLYGLVNVAAGWGQLRQGRIQRWAALGLALGGALIVAAALLLTRSRMAFWLLVTGLVAIHLLAINNGLRLHGRLHLRHHLVRAMLSVGLAALAWWVIP